MHIGVHGAGQVSGLEALRSQDVEDDEVIVFLAGALDLVDADHSDHEVRFGVRRQNKFSFVLAYKKIIAGPVSRTFTEA